MPEGATNAASDSGAAPVREVKTAKGLVKLVDVRIDSKPAGATVMLVDNGKTSFLGTTPVATSLDAGRAYDVVFTLEGRKTSMAHLDPSKSSRLAVSLHHESSAKKEPKVQKLAEPAFDVGSVVEKPAKTEHMRPRRPSRSARRKPSRRPRRTSLRRPKAVASTGGARAR